MAAVAGCVLGFAWVKTTRREPLAKIEPGSQSVRAAQPIIPLVVPTAIRGSVSGHVWNKEHQPIEASQVCAVCASCDPTAIALQQCVRTAEDGSFNLSELRPLAYRIVASAPGFTATFADQGQAMVVDAGVTRTGVEIVLDQEGVELSGHVLDATGGPIAGATVKFVRWTAPPLVAQAETDEEGYFTGRMPAGGVTLNASADGYARAGTFRVAPSRDIEIMLTPGASVRGVVLIGGDSTRPVVGAEVSAAAVGATSPAALTHSASDGSFVLEGLEPANYILSALGPGFRGHAPGVLALGLAQQVQGVTIRVMRQAKVSGKVVIGAGGAPCLEGSVTFGPRPPGAQFGLDSSLPPPDSERDARAGFRAMIGAGGAVQFDAVPSARYFVGVHCRDHRQQAGPVFVDVEASDVSGLVWRADPGLSLAIRVVDQAGQPVPAAQVSLEWPMHADGSAVTMPLMMDAEGRSETPASLLPGVYRLRPGQGQTGDPLTIELKEGMGRVEAVLKLLGSAAIAVSVRDTEGAAVDGLMVDAYPVSADGSESHGAALASAFRAAPQGAGMYRAGPLPPGRYRVEVTDAVNPPVEMSAMPGARRPLEVLAGRTTELSVSVERTAQIRGLVVDDSGAPAPDVWVTAANEAALAKLDPALRQLMPPARRVLTDSGGRFVVTGLDPRGVYRVQAEEPDGSAGRTLADVRAGSEVALTLARRADAGSAASDDKQASSSPRVGEGRAAVLGM